MIQRIKIHTPSAFTDVLEKQVQELRNELMVAQSQLHRAGERIAELAAENRNLRAQLDTRQEAEAGCQE